MCEVSFVRMGFDIPNRVIAELYYTYFREVLAEQTQLKWEAMDMAERVVALAREDGMGLVAEALQQVLERLSNRDARGLSEKPVQVVLLALLVPTEVYGVLSEWPVGRKYVDVYLGGGRR